MEWSNWKAMVYSQQQDAAFTEVPMTTWNHLVVVCRQPTGRVQQGLDDHFEGRKTPV